MLIKTLHTFRRLFGERQKINGQKNDNFNKTE